MFAEYLVMTFKTESGDKVDVTINGIKGDLAGVEVAAAMDVMIAKDAFIAKGGSLKTKVGAQVITKNVDQFKVN